MKLRTPVTLRLVAMATALCLTAVAPENHVAGGIPQPFLTALGDSITFGKSLRDPKVTGYAALLAKSLGADLTNLGIARETLIPVPNAVLDGKTSGGGQYRSKAGIRAEEVEQIPPQTTIVTVYIGTNDLWETTQAIKPDFSNEAAVFAGVTALWKSEFPALIQAIRARVPNARIFVASDINIANKGSMVNLGAEPYKSFRQGFSDLTNAMNATIESTGVFIANVHCDPRLYDTANYATIYDVHPNDAGHRALFEDFLEAINHPTTKIMACKYDQPLGPPVAK